MNFPKLYFWGVLRLFQMWKMISLNRQEERWDFDTSSCQKEIRLSKYLNGFAYLGRYGIDLDHLTCRFWFEWSETHYMTGWFETLKGLKRCFCICHTNFTRHPNKVKDLYTPTALKAFVGFSTFRPKKTHHILIHIPNLLHQKADHWRSMEFFFWWWVSLVIFFPTENKRKSTKRRLVSGTCTEPQWDVFVFFFPAFCWTFGGYTPEI